MLKTNYDMILKETFNNKCAQQLHISYAIRKMPLLSSFFKLQNINYILFKLNQIQLRKLLIVKDIFSYIEKNKEELKNSDLSITINNFNKVIKKEIKAMAHFDDITNNPSFKESTIYLDSIKKNSFEIQEYLYDILRLLKMLTYKPPKATHSDLALISYKISQNTLEKINAQ